MINERDRIVTLHLYCTHYIKVKTHLLRNHRNHWTDYIFYNHYSTLQSPMAFLDKQHKVRNLEVTAGIPTREPLNARPRRLPIIGLRHGEAQQIAMKIGTHTHSICQGHRRLLLGTDLKNSSEFVILTPKSLVFKVLQYSSKYYYNVLRDFHEKLNATTRGNLFSR